VRDLTPDECSHCFNLRRNHREQLEARGDDERSIRSALRDVLCREHQALAEERRRKERRGA
jgi:hypothetical protein